MFECFHRFSLRHRRPCAYQEEGRRRRPLHHTTEHVVIALAQDDGGHGQVLRCCRRLSVMPGPAAAGRPATSTKRWPLLASRRRLRHIGIEPRRRAPLDRGDLGDRARNDDGTGQSVVTAPVVASN